MTVIGYFSPWPYIVGAPLLIAVLVGAWFLFDDQANGKP